MFQVDLVNKTSTPLQTYSRKWNDQISSVKLMRELKTSATKTLLLKSYGLAGHAGIQGSDLADQCAKEAALQAEEIDFEDSQPLSFSEIKTEIKSDIINIWQRQWDRDEKSQLLHQIKPTVFDDSVIS